MRNNNLWRKCELCEYQHSKQSHNEAWLVLWSRKTKDICWSSQENWACQTCSIHYEGLHSKEAERTSFYQQPSETPLSGLIPCSPPHTGHLEISSQVPSLTPGLWSLMKSPKVLPVLNLRPQEYLLAASSLPWHSLGQPYCCQQAQSQSVISLNHPPKASQLPHLSTFFMSWNWLHLAVMQGMKIVFAVKSEDWRVLQGWGLDDRIKETREGQGEGLGRRQLQSL